LAKVAVKAASAGEESATLTAGLDEEHLTRPGVMLGIIAYMSPEQVAAKELDACTDLFSFGAVLYEMATGRMPFTGSSSGVICGAILHQEPMPASQLNLQLAPGLEAGIRKALEKDRALRYQSAADMRADLERLKRGAESGHLVSVTSGPVATSRAKYIGCHRPRRNRRGRCVLNRRSSGDLDRPALFESMTPFFVRKRP
jgi:serine/threonine protein kinase